MIPLQISERLLHLDDRRHVAVDHPLLRRIILLLLVPLRHRLVHCGLRSR